MENIWNWLFLSKDNSWVHLYSIEQEGRAFIRANEGGGRGNIGEDGDSI